MHPYDERAVAAEAPRAVCRWMEARSLLSNAGPGTGEEKSTSLKCDQHMHLQFFLLKWIHRSGHVISAASGSRHEKCISQLTVTESSDVQPLIQPNSVDTEEENTPKRTLRAFFTQMEIQQLMQENK